MTARPPRIPAARARRAAALVLTPLAVVAGWQAITQRWQHPYFPPPGQILSRMQQMWFAGPPHHLFLTSQALDNWLPSLARLAAGWAAAAFLGILLGMLIGRSRRAFDYLDPLLQFGRALPPPALVPVFIAAFNLGTPMELATIIFGVIWPVLLNSADGARSIDPLQLDTAAVFGITGALRGRYLLLPAAAPKIFAGLRLSLSLSLILMVLSELIGGTNGIGYQLQVAQRQFDIPQMWAGIILLGVLGLLLNTLFLAAEHRVLAWHHRSRQIPGSPTR